MKLSVKPNKVYFTQFPGSRVLNKTSKFGAVCSTNQHGFFYFSWKKYSISAVTNIFIHQALIFGKI